MTEKLKGTLVEASLNKIAGVEYADVTVRVPIDPDRPNNHVEGLPTIDDLRALKGASVEVSRG